MYIYIARGKCEVSVLSKTYPRTCNALQYKYLPQATTSTDTIAIVLIEQIRKEIKVPWLMLSKRPGKRRIREEERKKKGLGIAVAWPTKKNEHAQKSKAREKGKENRTFMPRGTGMGMADPSNQMQMNKDKKKR